MLKIEEVALKVKALEDAVKAAFVPIEDARKRIRTWLISKDQPVAEIDGTIKALLEVRKARTETQTVVDEVAVQAEFLELLRRGRYTQAEVVDLLRSGILMVSNTEALTGAVALKIRGYVPPTRIQTTTVVAGDPQSSPLKLNVLAKGRFQGLKDRLRYRLDFAAEVQQILDNPLPELPTPAGQAALSRTRRA